MLCYSIPNCQRINGEIVKAFAERMPCSYIASACVCMFCFVSGFLAPHTFLCCCQRHGLWFFTRVVGKLGYWKLCGRRSSPHSPPCAVQRCSVLDLGTSMLLCKVSGREIYERLRWLAWLCEAFPFGFCLGQLGRHVAEKYNYVLFWFVCWQASSDIDEGSK